MEFNKRSHRFEKLKQIDIFPRKVELFIKEQEGHKTLLGAILTLGIGSILVILLISDISSLLYRDNATTTVNQLYVDKPALTHLFPTNFTIQFDLEDENFKNYLDPSIYVVTGSLIHKYTDSNNIVQFDSEQLPLQVCSNSSFQQTELAQKFLTFNPATEYCINWTNLKSIPLVGQFSNSDYRYIEIDVSLCNNHTKQNVECKNRSTILQQTLNNYFSIQLTSSQVDLTNPFSPNSYMMQDSYTTLSNTMFKQIDIFLAPLITQTDFGLLSSNIIEVETLKFSSMEERLLLSNNDLLLKLAIRLDTNQNINIRTYPKLQVILGQLGGVWQVLFTVCSLLYYPISTLSYKLEIINSLFNFVGFDDEKHPPKKIQGSQMSINLPSKFGSKQKIINNLKQNINDQMKKVNVVDNSQPTYKNILQQYENLKQISTSLRKYFKQSERSLELFYSDYLSLACNCRNPCSKNKRTQIIGDQIKYSTEKISKSLDILYIVRKLNEIDRLKMILLDQDQINLFDYLPKPTIGQRPFSQNITGDHCYFSILKKEKDDFEVALEAQRSFKVLQKHKQLPINQNILQQLSPDIQQIFDIEGQDGGVSMPSNCEFGDQIDEQIPNSSSRQNIQLNSLMNSKREINIEQ